MLKRLFAFVAVVGLCLPAFAVAQQHGVVVGEITKADSASKKVVVKAADGTEHVFSIVARTAVHGTTEGADDALHGLKEGSKVAIHYTARGTEETADEVDHIGEGGLKSTQATVVHLDRGAKTLTVQAEDGTKETYRLTDSAARDAGKDIAKGSEKSAKVTVYYSEDAGHKVAHFFESAM